MRGFAATTDFDWFESLSRLSTPPSEVNFWRPGPDLPFKALRPGEPLFFKLKQPHHAIAGFGLFAWFSPLPIAVAWDVYGMANGASSIGELRERLLRARTAGVRDERRDLWAGCILLSEPVFFPQERWIDAPRDWTPTIGHGLTMDLSRGEGRRIWNECLARAQAERAGDPQPAHGVALPIVTPRLGPKSFHIAVFDAYGRRCAVTGEPTLPALAAAHIRVDGESPAHTVNNGILLRADIQKLFVAGYVTVNPDFQFLVSRRLASEFENGREYERLHGSSIRLPHDPASRPFEEALWWHNEERFLK